MVIHYLRIAWRVLTRNKVYSSINVAGLGLGVCACLVIGTIVRYEFSFDRHQPDRDRIYRVTTDERITKDMPLMVAPNVPPELGGAIRSGVPGVEVVAPYHVLTDAKVNIPGNRNIFATTTPIVTGAEYFHIMPYEWLAGDRETALTEPFKIVISENKARQYFGDLPPDRIIGRTIVYDDSLTVSVTGVIRDWTANTNFPYSEFISLASTTQPWLRGTLELDAADRKDMPLSSRILLKLKPATDPATVNKVLASLFSQTLHPGLYTAARLQALSDVYFTPVVEETTIRTAHQPTLYALSAIALFILVLAVINYVNLSTAQSLSRDKEIGIRKVLGSSRISVIVQFLTETLVLTIAAVLLAVLFVRPVLVAFRAFVPVGVEFHLFEPGTVIFLLTITVVTTILAGLYPARLLASFLPKLSLRGAGAPKGSEKWLLRKGLIVFQFAVSLVFIIGTLVIGRQIHFMLNHDLGFRSDAIGSANTDESRDSLFRVKNLEASIGQLPGVSGVARENMPPMGSDLGVFGVQYRARSDERFSVQAIKADENFIPLYGLRMLAGRNLEPSDTLREVVINETLSKALGFRRPEDAIGKMLFTWNKNVPIAGVVADFHKRSFHEPVKPLLIAAMACTDLAIRLDTKGKSVGEARAILDRVQRVWKQFYPHMPFEFSFLDDEIAQLYTKEATMSWLMKIATGITLFISCIGLFGLTMFTAERRTKEIGIRKVLGATVRDIVLLLGRDFVWLVGLAFVIAAPVAWIFMHRWLEDYAYRISFGPGLFVVSAFSLLVITLATVSWHSVRAALANPVESLRQE
jgi:putative ABC transport system permease protein